MKSQFFVKDKLEEEKEKKEELSVEEKKKQEYFKRLKEDDNFQKYVVNDIIIANIKSLTDLNMIAYPEKKDKEALADLILANLKASKVLTNILAAIVN